jgi:SAM-dependent methyltransferase
MMIEPNNISYRDTAARVVKKESGYYRYIFHEYKAEYDYLMQSGLYQELTKKRLLIEHQEIALDTKDPKVYKQLFPRQIPFQSYPFEWSYTQWRKAILAYLRINHIALGYGMILKDATPYNFYLTGGKAVMFDTSSFKFFKENDSWIAYRKFCEEFLSPVTLMHYNGPEWSKLTMANLRGLPLDFVSKQLPIKSWLNLTTLLHIHIHSKYFGHYESLDVEKKNKGFTTEKIKSLQKMIFKTIYRWEKPYQFKSHWSTYYQNDIESPEYLKDKEATIRRWLDIIKPKSILDLGSNTGKFSFIAAEYAERVISLEGDTKCVDKIEEQINLRKLDNLYTLIGNIAELTPSLGFHNFETKSINSRVNSDLVLGLALVHHLHINNQLSFAQIVEMFFLFSSQYLIVEFIPITDNKVQLLMRDKKINLSDYNEVSFTNILSKWYNIIENVSLKETERKLILLKKR